MYLFILKQTKKLIVSFTFLTLYANFLKLNRLYVNITRKIKCNFFEERIKKSRNKTLVDIRNG
jgi:hypothetical protein